MPDELRNSRTVHNRLSSQLLYRLMDFRGWTELKLAEMSGILPSVVSAHLCGSAVSALNTSLLISEYSDRQERGCLLGRMVARQHGLRGDRESTRRHQDSFDVVSLKNQCRMLDWWATAIASDSKFAKIFTRLSTKAGFRSPSMLLLPVSTAAAQLQSLAAGEGF
jgi:hypothetical protein